MPAVLLSRPLHLYGSSYNYLATCLQTSIGGNILEDATDLRTARAGRGIAIQKNTLTLVLLMSGR